MKLPFRKEDYLGNPKTRPVWEACKELLDGIELVQKIDGDKGYARAQLIDTIDQLEALEILPGMNVGLKKEAYDDPLVVVRWLAGQILTGIEKVGIKPMDDLLGSEERNVGVDSDSELATLESVEFFRRIARRLEI